MKLFLKRQGRGYVTIMLCILMLPMVLFSTIVVDYSRIMYAKTIVAGAGDLVLNAQMSEFDRVLQEMYGIFASSASEKELKDSLRIYFERTIRGDLPELSEKDDYVQALSNTLLDMAFSTQAAGSLSFDNLLSFALDDGENGFNVEGVTGSAIANPAVLKRQIIDAMKYRAPISVASSLLNKVHAFKNSKAQAEVVENKVNYTRSLDKLGAACQKAAEDILSYDVFSEMYNERLDSLPADLCNRLRYYIFGALVAEQYRADMEASKRPDKENIEKVVSERLRNDYSQNSQQLTDSWTKYTQGKLSYQEKKYQERLADMASEEDRFEALDELNQDLENIYCILEEIIKTDSGRGLLEDYLLIDILITDTNNVRKTSFIQNESTEQLISYKEMLEMISKSKQDMKASTDITLSEMTGDIDLKSRWSEWLSFADNQKKVLNGEGKLARSREAQDLISKYCNAGGKIEELMGYYRIAVESQTRYEESQGTEDSVKLLEYKEKLENWENKKNDYYLVWKEPNSIFTKMKTDLTNFETEVCTTNFISNILTGFVVWAQDVYMDYLGNSKMVSYFADRVESDLNKISVILDELKKNKEDWSKSIDKVDDGVTKATFESDYQTTTEAFNEKDIDNLIKEVKTGKRKVPYVKKLSNMVEGTRFWNDPIATGNVFEGLLLSSYHVESLLQGNGVVKKAARWVAFSDKLSLVKIEEVVKRNRKADETVFDTANRILHNSGGKSYRVSDELQKLIGEDITEGIPSHHFWCVSAGALKGASTSIEEIGYIDGFKDDQQGKDIVYSGDKSDEDGNIVEFFSWWEQLNSAKDENEKFVFDLFAFLKKYESEKLNETQKKQKEELENEIKDVDSKANGNNEELTKDRKYPTTQSAVTYSAMLTDFMFTMGKIISYDGSTEEQNSKKMDSGDTSQMGGTTVPSEKKNKSEEYSGEGDKASGTLSGGSTWLDNLVNLGETLVKNVYLEEYFTEMFTCDMDRSVKYQDEDICNLFGVKYNKDNYWYGQEVEFLLWGNPAFGENVKTTYKTIYVIRLILNAIYAFTASDIQTFAKGMATTICSAFPFAIPLVQAIITIALALAESGFDIEALKKGEDVVIYKNKQTFICSPTGLLGNMTEKIKEELVGKAKEFVGEKCSEFIDGLKETVEGTVKDVEYKIGDKIGDLENYIDKTVGMQTQVMKDQIIDFVMRPMSNALTSLTDRMHFPNQISEEKIDEAVDMAMTSISTSIKNQPESMMRDLEEKAFDLIKNNGLDTIIKSKIKEKYKAGELTTQRVLDILETELEKKLEGMDAFSKAVDECTSKLATEAKNGLHDITEKGLEEFEGYMDETAGKINEKINGKISEYSEKWESKNETASNPTGGAALTLNYKEYCKIFVLVGIATNEKTMLQRAAALMQINVRVGNGEDIPASPKFKSIDACTLFRATAEVHINTLFPWGIRTYLGDMAETEDKSWHISLEDMGSYDATLFYTGVNGY